jgi:putative Mg2+ transporter-C (MgtC) family protein
MLDYLRELNLVTILVRLLLATAVGGVLGMERERKNRPAGFRTYMLVCVGAAMVMMTNQYAFQYFTVSDPVRMGAQVISGIGFLGAGTIMVTGKNKIKGITTAAGLWTAASCGLAIGVGFYEGAIAGGLVIFLIISVMQRLEDPIRRHAKYMEVYLEFDDKNPLSAFIDYTRENQLEVYDIQMQKNYVGSESFMAVVLLVRGRQKMTHSEMMEKLGAAPGVRFLEELQ